MSCCLPGSSLETVLRVFAGAWVHRHRPPGTRQELQIPWRKAGVPQTWHCWCKQSRHSQTFSSVRVVGSLPKSKLRPTFQAGLSKGSSLRLAVSPLLHNHTAGMIGLKLGLKPDSMSYHPTFCFLTIMKGIYNIKKKRSRFRIPVSNYDYEKVGDKRLHISCPRTKAAFGGSYRPGTLTQAGPNAKVEFSPIKTHCFIKLIIW